MNAKDKAKDLLNKMISAHEFGIEVGKKLASICIDEIISEFEEIEYKKDARTWVDDGLVNINEALDYYRMVNLELEKL